VPAFSQQRTGVVVGPSTQLTTNVPSLIGALLTQPQAVKLCWVGGPINPSFTATNNLQAEEYGGGGQPFTPLQGFPTATARFVALSSGNAELAAGVYTTFNSYSFGGPDSVTLAFDCNACPTTRGRYSIQWTYCTEENPTYLNTVYQDPGGVSIVGSGGGAALDILTVDAAIPLSNAVTGSSTSPTGPSPSPNDVVYNACLLPLNRPRTVTANIIGSARFTLSQQDAGDTILDTTSFFDNVTVDCRLVIDLKPGSNPNCERFNRGMTAVAILGLTGFNPVLTVNQSTILFDGAAPKRCSAEDVNLDGKMDLVCHFERMDMATAAAPPANCKVVELTATLYDGTPVSGSDVLCTPGGENCALGLPTTAPF